MASSFPSERSLITSLISSIPIPPVSATDTSSNPLKSADKTTKSLLVTLHVLYPDEFLPALDVLDRHLVTRYDVRRTDEPALNATGTSNAPLEVPTPIGHRAEPAYQSQPESNEKAPAARAAPPLPRSPIYFVRSAQPPSKRFESAGGRFHDPLLTHYEVRLAAWSCSCPAFAFAAFPASDRPQRDHEAPSAAAEASTTAEPEPARPGKPNPTELSAALAADNDVGFGGVALDGGLPPVCKHLLACALVERCDVFRPLAEVKNVSADELGGWCAGWGG